jgi:hypothetical protein
MTLKCSCFGYAGRTSNGYGKYGFCESHIRSFPIVSFNEPDTIEMRVSLGKDIISHLPEAFKQRNKGRFLAVTLSGNVVAVCPSLEALNEEIVRKQIRENYYIERLGHSTMADI